MSTFASTFTVFAWDPVKADNNEQKHGVGFDEATSVFLDNEAQLIADPDHSIGEERFLLLGLSVRFRFLIVCHCYREDAHVIRIISARKADRKETNQYLRACNGHHAHKQGQRLTPEEED